MLTHLHIENFVLIKNLDLDFNSGFSVITGQTGAGKSIMLGALELALGAKADSKAIFQGEKKCVIEATFNVKGYGLESFFEDNDIDYSDECIIRRELSDNGKSRSFLNDTPVLVSILKQIGIRLIDIHSQHSSLLLESNAFQLSVVDSVADNAEALKNYKQQFKSYADLCHRIDTLKEQAENAKSNADYLQFQYKQLVDSNLKEGELTSLEENLNALEHTSDIKNSLQNASVLLYGDDGVLTKLHSLQNSLNSISSFGSNYADLAGRVSSCTVELKDVYGEIEHSNESVDVSPTQLEQMRGRLDTLYSLLQKHRVKSVEELIAIRDSIGEQLKGIENFDSDLEALEKEKSEMLLKLKALASVLYKNRCAAVEPIKRSVEDNLRFLGMPDSKFEIEFTECSELTSCGGESVQFLFSSNKTKPQPIQSSASGGEISRVMLCLKALIAKNTNLPTLIFDEIDTGISGNIASQMGTILKNMSESMQIICITHLPQVAAKGSTHYSVYKDSSVNPVQTIINTLDNTQRITEIAAMLSGDNITDAAVANAKELIEN
ncbi:MAG: DNA repair protein RecN [Paludibacteraceae bacterium]|nr:DNA repair protein RecN [Paludibacteraceae bacterium]